MSDCNVAPNSSLLPEAKLDLLRKYLQEGSAPSASNSPVIPRRVNGVPPPLSFAQQQLWVHTQFVPDISVYNETLTVFKAGPLNVSALERAFTEIVSRHEAWRTTFSMVDGQPVQVVHQASAVKLPVIDLRRLPKPEREAEAVRLATEEARRPFDLSAGPLVRAMLVRLSNTEHRLFLTVHHMIFDAVSIYRVFLPELTALYEAFAAGKPSPLPELPIQYADFASWQRQFMQNGSVSSHMAYWTQKLGDLTVLELPTDRPRPAVQAFHGSTQKIVLQKGLCDELKAISRHEGATLFMTLLAAFKALLQRYTAQDNIVVGTIAAGRKQSELDGLLGCFHNPLALRTDLSGDPTFRELLARVRETTLGALSHDDVPFELLVNELQHERDLSRNPLFQVCFSLVPSMPAVGAGWDITQLDIETGVAKFDLDLELDDRPDGIVGRFMYNTDLFDASSIARMCGHFQTLLEGIVVNPNQRLSTLPLLSEAERQQLLVEWNDTRADYPKDKCVHQLVEEQVERTPDAVAVVHENRQLTYRELNQRANQMAHYLRRCGVGPETRVGICLERSLEMAVALLGILKAGGTCVPLDPKYPNERLAYMREDAQAPVLLTQPGLLPGFTKAGCEVICLTPNRWAIIGQESRENASNEVEPEGSAYIIYTSGSTGKPRGVVLTHGGLLNHNTAMVKLYDLTPADRVLQFSSISFDIAIEEIFPTWIAGAALVLKTDEMPLGGMGFLRWVRQRAITVLDLPTAFWHEWMHDLSDLRTPLPESLRLVIVGGEKASASAYAAWLKLGGDRVRWMNTYGPTETTVIATAYEPKLTPGSDDVPSEIPIGKPIANMKIHILDSRMQPVPIGVPGELVIGGAGVARGYLNRPELSAEKFIPDPFSNDSKARLYRTGDLARYTPDGNIEFRGRTDDQVKIRGFRIELGEIEAVLGQHPGVAEVVVLAREDTPGTKRLAAYVVPGPEAPTSSELRTYLKQKLPEYMVPPSYVMLAQMPLTPNGKVDKRALPAPVAPELVPQERFAAPKDAVESQLVKIWESVLGTRPISVKHNFFELGGHSLLAVRLMHRMEQALGKKLPLATLFQAPTIEQLAVLLRQDGWSPAWSSIVPVQPRGSKPPFFLVHGLGGAVLMFRDLARHLAPDQPVYALQAQGIDGKHPCHTRIEDMAAHYIKEVRTIQAEGPYFLGGLSFGGTVAFEMARQFHAQDQGVALLALLDTFPGRPETKGSLLVKLFRLPAKQRMDYISRKLTTYRNNIGRRIGRLWLPGHLKNLQSANIQASQTYEMQPYYGPVTLFLPSKKSLRSAEDPQGGWGEWAAGGLEVHNVPGDHLGMMVDPNARHLAEKLRACLEKAQSKDSSPTLKKQPV